MKRLFASIAVLVAFSSHLHAHERGENYIFIEFHEDKIDGRFEFKADELQKMFGFDVYENGAISEEKIKANAQPVFDYIRENFSMGPNPNEDYTINFTEAVHFNAEGGWAQYLFYINTPTKPDLLYIDHNMAYDNNRFHRGMLIIEKGEWTDPNYKMHMSLIFSKGNSSQVLDVNRPQMLMKPRQMVKEGVRHILIGIDHILFLVVLALPIVLVRSENQQEWKAAHGLKQTLWPLLKMVTVFTLAHSITLLLASLEIITLPSRLVESVIALSIILVALNNIFGKSHNTSLFIIFVLGLFHGLGFASVMAELPFRITDLTTFLKIIIGFNIGVEIGQVAILLLLFPVLYLLRSTKLYPPVFLRGGSTVLIGIAGYWLVTRALGI